MSTVDKMELDRELSRVFSCFNEDPACLNRESSLNFKLKKEQNTSVKSVLMNPDVIAVFF